MNFVPRIHLFAGYGKYSAEGWCGFGGLMTDDLSKVTCKTCKKLREGTWKSKRSAKAFGKELDTKHKLS